MGSFRTIQVRKERISLCQKRQHASGASLFRAIRIVAIQIAGGTNTAVVYCRDAEVTALPHNLAGEIRFIMRRTNAWTELHNDIRGARTKMFRHRADGVGDDTKLRPFFSGMHQTNRIAYGIDDENGATISNINAEANAALICDQPIKTVETFVPCGRRMDNTDALSVHLLRGNERRAAKSMFLSDFPMNAVQPSERFHFIMRQLDIGDTQCETVNDVVQRAERRELFSRKLPCVHLPEMVVRVVRVVLVVWTGCLSPA